MDAADAKREIKLEDIPGIGPKIAQRLREVGFDDPVAIAVSSASELAAIAEIGEATAAKIINAVREMLEMGFETADKILEKRQKIGKITTGSKALDNLLGGGIQTQAITEFFGEFATGKTQVGFQLAINVQLPPEKGGLGGGTLIIDTESTFRPERIVQIAKAMDLDPKEVLKNIYVARAYNSDHQLFLIEKADSLIREKNIKLLIVDSLMSHFRADYVGRGELATRQQKVNKMMHTLQRLADAYNIAVYVTNQVMARPDVLFGDPTATICDHVVAHQDTYRVYLRKSKGDRRIAQLRDSPDLPPGECVFRITEEGIRDV